MNIKKITLAVLLMIMLLYMGLEAYPVTYYYSFNAGCDGGKHADGGWVYYNGGSVKLQKGCFLQYIYAGTDNLIDPPSSSGGITDDDIILLTGEVGSDYGTFSTLEGEFYYTYAATIENVSSPQIYVRAWSTYEADIHSDAYYGESQKITLTTVPGGPSPTPNDYGLASFETSSYHDNNPPGPPTNFIATQEVSGDLILSWTKTISPDAVITRIVCRTDRMPTRETEGTVFTTDISTAAAQAYRHTGLTNGQRYYYSAFSRDGSSNYSGPASTSEVSLDTLPPSVVSWSPTGMSVDPTSNISITFNDVMNKPSVQSAIYVLPSVTITGYNWTNGDKTITYLLNNLTQSVYYTVTMDTTAKDKANNSLTATLEWTFRTQAGLPPTITDMKIDGWKRYPGDTISLQPRVTAIIGDPESTPPASGIVTIEISANGSPYIYTSAELTSIFNNITGDLNFRFPTFLPAGAYTITVEAWDLVGNPSIESSSGLIIRGGAGGIIGPILNFPSVFKSGQGTTLSYNLSVDTDLVIYVYSIKGNIMLKKKITARTPGGTAGYNEVYWDGLSDFHEEIGNGIYIVKIAIGDNVIGSSKVVIQN